MLGELTRLAKDGRIRSLIEEAQRLEEQRAELAPWFTHLRTLARRFEIESLKQFIQGSQEPSQ